MKQRRNVLKMRTNTVITWHLVKKLVILTQLLSIKANILFYYAVERCKSSIRKSNNKTGHDAN